MAGAQVGKAVGALAAKGRVSLKELAAHTLRAESPEAEPREDGEDTGRRHHPAHDPHTYPSAVSVRQPRPVSLQSLRASR